jgi:hypothetical protein
MSALARIGRRRAEAPAEETPPAGPPKELIERRAELSRWFAELQWDLGGLAYEMASRDHFRLDVIVRRAAELQEVDAELGEVERLLRLDDAAAAGSCPSCGALHSRGAVFCWQCGTSLLERVAAAAVASPDVLAPPTTPPARDAPPAPEGVRAVS